ncbi:hypothetical protein [Ornithinimicrobium flavum]|uniref:hypothetical protein n=1 Tax=Ornithinimicrobium flavum TaxID=1288636 RepID=UPI00308416FD
MTRDLDLTLFGATGFVGRLTAEHLAATAPGDVRVALAGRSRERLEQVRDGLGPRPPGGRWSSPTRTIPSRSR